MTDPQRWPRLQQGLLGLPVAWFAQLTACAADLVLVRTGRARNAIGAVWLAEYVPALQGRGRSAPVLHAWPVGQTLHCAGLSKPVTFEKVPGLHGKGAEERLAQ